MQEHSDSLRPFSRLTFTICLLMQALALYPISTFTKSQLRPGLRSFPRCLHCQVALGTRPGSPGPSRVGQRGRGERPPGRHEAPGRRRQKAGPSRVTGVFPGAPNWTAERKPGQGRGHGAVPEEGEPNTWMENQGQRSTGPKRDSKGVAGHGGGRPRRLDQWGKLGSETAELPGSRRSLG